MALLDAREVGDRLGLSARLVSWLACGEESLAPVLPNDDMASAWLASLEVPLDSRREILATRPDPVADPEIWWVIKRVYTDLVGSLGSGVFDGWPSLPIHGTARVRHLYIWAFLAALPNVRRYHIQRAIPAAIGWDALRSLGSAVTDSRRLFGKSGLLFDLWVQPLAFRGVHYRIGRLGYDVLGSCDGDTDGTDLNVHISGGGPLIPDECDASFAAALDFFRKHFPERPVRRFIPTFSECDSRGGFPGADESESLVQT
ncbi:MAG: acyltransferase domain-containing protein, partial [Pseudorhizobium sp.]